MFFNTFAEISLSGYQEFFLGSGDVVQLGSDATSPQTGVSQAGLSSQVHQACYSFKTLDNGIEVIGVYSIMKDSDFMADAM